MQLLGAGRDADVFALDGGRVLRRYRNPRRSAEREARVMTHARAAGLPVPEVVDVAGPDLVLERIEGPTMAAALVRRPWTLAAHARVLGELHRAVHAVPAPDWLDGPSFDAGPAGSAGSLLHLDLHPENVLLGSGGPVVIDWTNAARGAAAVDVADAWLVMTVARPAGGRAQAAVAAVAQGTFARSFRRAAGLDLRAALPAAAGRRLGDPNLGHGERRRIRRLAGQG